MTHRRLVDVDGWPVRREVASDECVGSCEEWGLQEVVVVVMQVCRWW